MSYLISAFARRAVWGLGAAVFFSFCLIITFLSKLFEVTDEDKAVKSCKIFLYLTSISLVTAVFCAVGWGLLTDL